MAGILAGAGAGNSNSVSSTDINKYKELTSTTLSNSSLIKTVQNLVSSTISSTVVNNSQSIKSLIDAYNSINYVGGKNCKPMSGNINIRNIKQEIKINDTQVNESIINIVSNLTATINTNIVNNIKNITQDSQTKTNSEKVSSSFEGIVSAITDGINKCVDDVAELASGAGGCAGIGNSCSQSTSKETDTKLQTKYGLDNKFSLNKIIEQNNETLSEITQNNVNNIIASISGSNQIGVTGLCPTYIDISNINQKITINNLNKNTSIISIANNVATNYITNIQNIINNMNEHKITDTTIKSTGDIGDLGDALAGVIHAGGNAVSDQIEAVGTASSVVIGKTIDGTSNIVNKSVGAAGSVLSGLFLPLIIIGVIGALYMFVIKPQMEKKNNPTPETELTETPSNKYRSINGFHGFLQNISDSIKSNNS
jgi:hypothetical protein